jgi:transposase
MSRQFRTANYAETLKQTIRLEEALPEQHLARFVVDLITHLDLRRIYAQYAPQGGEAIAPEILLGLLFYGYATGLFSSRKIEKATYESIPFRFIAGGLHPDHDPIAHFRKTFLSEIKDLFVQILLLAQAVGVLKLGNISLDGGKIHADASKSHAVSYKRLIEIEAQLKGEVNELFALGEQVDQGELGLPEALVLQDEIAIRQERLANLAKAKAELEERAKSVMRRKRPSMMPKCVSAPPNRRKRDRATKINSISPTLSPGIGKPEAVAMDNGYFSAANLRACQKRGIEAYIATGREAHHPDWHTFFRVLGQPPAEDASAQSQNGV